MKLYAVGGFFGSGKTTLILRLARWLCLEKGQRLVIVQNEIGKIGIDDQLLKAAGLDVTPLLGGCICCNLQVGLVSTMLKIVAEDRADVVILETSGMAAPNMLGQILRDSSMPPMDIRFLFLLDLARIQRLKNWFSLPFVEAYLRSGGIVVANKIDAVTEEFRAAFREQARELSPDSLIAEVSLSSGDDLPEVIRFMLDGDPKGHSPCCGDLCDHESHHEHDEVGHHHGHVEHPAVCVRQRDAITVAGFSKAVGQMLVSIAQAASAAGGLIAHIKVFAQDHRGKCAGCSVTHPDESPRWSADPDALSGPVILTVNAIVFGMEEPELSPLVDAALCSLDAAHQTG